MCIRYYVELRSIQWCAKLSPPIKRPFANTPITASYANGLKLPGHPQNPNFFYEIILGLTQAKSAEDGLF